MWHPDFFDWVAMENSDAMKRALQTFGFN